MASTPIRLRLVRHLDQERLSDELAEHLERHEGTTVWVDGDLARDLIYTEEIMEITDRFALLNPDGSIIAQYKSLAAAEKARASARVTLAVEADPEPEAEEPEEE